METPAARRRDIAIMVAQTRLIWFIILDEARDRL